MTTDLAPVKVASPQQLAAMSWHQRNTYQRRIRAWLDEQHRIQHQPGPEIVLLRRIIAGLDQATREHDRDVRDRLSQQARNRHKEHAA